ncbi:MAG: hypothetical protein AB8B97_15470 [Granulosicoccus sp.]
MNKLPTILAHRMTFFLVVSWWLFVATAHADIGRVTINDEVVPAIVFKGFTQHNMLKKDVCPPTSNAYIRDAIIRRALIIAKGQELGLTIDERSKNNVDEFAQTLEYLGPDGNPREIAKAEVLRHMHRYIGFLDHFPAPVRHEEILAEYKRLIKAGDSRFTNVVVVRFTPLEFRSVKDAEAAIEALNAGEPVKEVTDRFPEGFYGFHRSPQWIPIYDVDDYEGDGSELTTGTAISIGGVDVIYFDEVKFRSRLRPFTEYRNSDSYVYKEVKWDLLKIKQRERDRALWEAADVREDGMPIVMSSDYPKCS